MAIGIVDGARLASNFESPNWYFSQYNSDLTFRAIAGMPSVNSTLAAGVASIALTPASHAGATSYAGTMPYNRPLISPMDVRILQNSASLINAGGAWIGTAVTPPTQSFDMTTTTGTSGTVAGTHSCRYRSLSDTPFVAGLSVGANVQHEISVGFWATASGGTGGITGTISTTIDIQTWLVRTSGTLVSIGTVSQTMSLVNPSFDNAGNYLYDFFAGAYSPNPGSGAPPFLRRTFSGSHTPQTTQAGDRIVVDVVCTATRPAINSSVTFSMRQQIHAKWMQKIISSSSPIEEQGTISTISVS